jgi:hypothetical protein
MAMVTCAIMANLTYGTAIMMRTYSWYIILTLLKHGSKTHSELSLKEQSTFHGM